MSHIVRFDDEKVLLPLMPLREVVMFPRSIVPLFVGREQSIKAIEKAHEEYDRQIFLVAQKNPVEEQPGEDQLHALGTVSRILQMLRLPDGTVKVLFEGLYRASWEFSPEGDFARDNQAAGAFPLVLAHPVADIGVAKMRAEAAIRAALSSLEEYSAQNKKMTPEVIQSITAHTDPGRLADAIVPHVKGDFVTKQEILETLRVDERLEKVCGLLFGELAIAALEKRIKVRVKDQMEQNQKEYYLNEQIKAIHKEMGREDDPSLEVDELELRMKALDMPDAAREKGLKEIKKLRQIPSSSAEYTVVRNYVDWILDLPWNALKETDIDIVQAGAILDADHFALEKPKERILEYLAVQKLSSSLKGPILCLVGPPGVGKTSLARSVASATGREFVRLSLGGVRDEAEIRGHRRTYVGAMPGKIIQSLKRAKFNNPLFCLDEIDKMSADFRGDPSSALLEVLDPEQNNSFNDHYLDLDYDLSQVFFITTANSLHSIPPALKDRMEIIRLPGYLETEKVSIARGFLLPKQKKAHGLKEANLDLSSGALLEIIRSYTKEAGVRNLERELAAVCRKVAMQLVSDGNLHRRVQVTRQSLGRLLGIKKYRYGEREAVPQTGVCTGLAYTEFGGELLLVETALMPGTGKLNITGQLGEVMTESAKAALSYIRSRSDTFGLRPDFYKDIDIHIHVPEGAIPKDGPSAGIALASSLTSAFLGIPVRNDIAMTGEITLRGRVLPIGGLREKLLAAHRGLVKTVIIPQDNQKDLKEVPAEVLKDMEIVAVAHVDQVLPLAMLVSSEDLFSGVQSIQPLWQSLKTGARALRDSPTPQ